MKNEIIKINKQQYHEIMNGLNKDDTYIVELDGKDIQDERTLYIQMRDKFKLFDDFIAKRIWYDAYNDWMRDLWNIEEKKIVLIIMDYKLMLKDFVNEKQLYIDEFRETILPFWEEEVVHTVVEGERKEFTVYLVD